MHKNVEHRAPQGHFRIVRILSKEKSSLVGDYDSRRETSIQLALAEHEAPKINHLVYDDQGNIEPFDP